MTNLVSFSDVDAQVQASGRKIKALADLGLGRQATQSPEALALYAEHLQHEAPDVVELACAQLLHTERPAGETAFPPLATVERVCREIRHAREDARRPPRQEYVGLPPEEAKKWLAKIREMIDTKRAEAKKSR